MIALFAQDYCGLSSVQNVLSVTPHDLGYQVISAVDGETYLIMHEEIHRPDFCLHDVLAVILEGFSE